MLLRAINSSAGGKPARSSAKRSRPSGDGDGRQTSKRHGGRALGGKSPGKEAEALEQAKQSFYLAKEAVRSGEHGLAEESLLQTLDRLHGHAEKLKYPVYVELGNLYQFHLQKKHQAVVHYVEALRRNAADPFVWYNCGLAAMALGGAKMVTAVRCFAHVSTKFLLAKLRLCECFFIVNDQLSFARVFASLQLDCPDGMPVLETLRHHLLSAAPTTGHSSALLLQRPSKRPLDPAQKKAVHSLLAQRSRYRQFCLEVDESAPLAPSPADRLQIPVPRLSWKDLCLSVFSAIDRHHQRLAEPFFPAVATLPRRRLVRSQDSSPPCIRSNDPFVFFDTESQHDLIHTTADSSSSSPSPSSSSSSSLSNTATAQREPSVSRRSMRISGQFLRPVQLQMRSVQLSAHVDSLLCDYPLEALTDTDSPLPSPLPDSQPCISDAEQAAVQRFIAQRCDARPFPLSLRDALLLVFDEVLLVDDCAQTTVTAWDSHFIRQALAQYERDRDALSPFLTARQHLLLAAMHIQLDIDERRFDTRQANTDSHWDKALLELTTLQLGVTAEPPDGDSHSEPMQLLSNWVQGWLWEVTGDTLRADVFFEQCKQLLQRSTTACIPLLCAPSIRPVCLDTIERLRSQRDPLQRKGALGALFERQQFADVVQRFAGKRKALPTTVHELYYLHAAQLRCGDAVPVGDLLACAAALLRHVLDLDAANDVRWMTSQPDVPLRLLHDIAGVLFHREPASGAGEANASSVVEFMRVLLAMIRALAKKGHESRLACPTQRSLFEQTCTCVFLSACQLPGLIDELPGLVEHIHSELQTVNLSCSSLPDLPLPTAGFALTALRYMDRHFADRLHPSSSSSMDSDDGALQSAFNLLLTCKFGFKLGQTAAVHLAANEVDADHRWRHSFDLVDWVADRYFLPMIELDQVTDVGDFVTAALAAYEHKLPVLRSNERVSFEQIYAKTSPSHHIECVVVDDDDPTPVQNDETTVVQNDETTVVQNDDTTVVQTDDTTVVQTDDTTVQNNDETTTLAGQIDDDDDSSTLEQRACKLLLLDVLSPSSREHGERKESRRVKKAVLLDPSNPDGWVQWSRCLRKKLKSCSGELAELRRVWRRVAFVQDRCTRREDRLTDGELSYGMLMHFDDEAERSALIARTIDRLSAFLSDPCEPTVNQSFTCHYLLGKALLKAGSTLLTDDGATFQVLHTLRRALRDANQYNQCMAYYALHAARLKLARLLSSSDNDALLSLLLAPDCSAAPTFEALATKRPQKPAASEAGELVLPAEPTLFEQVAADVYQAMMTALVQYSWQAHKAAYRAAVIAEQDFGNGDLAARILARFWGSQQKNHFLRPYYLDRASRCIQRTELAHVRLALKYCTLWSDVLFKLADVPRLLDFVQSCIGHRNVFLMQDSPSDAVLIFRAKLFADVVELLLRQPPSDVVSDLLARLQKFQETGNVANLLPRTAPKRKPTSAPPAAAADSVLSQSDDATVTASSSSDAVLAATPSATVTASSSSDAVSATTVSPSFATVTASSSSSSDTVSATPSATVTASSSPDTVSATTVSPPSPASSQAPLLFPLPPPTPPAIVFDAVL